jgi:hypothetical protein
MFAKRALGQSSLRRLLHGHQGRNTASWQHIPHQGNPRTGGEEID